MATDDLSRAIQIDPTDEDYYSKRGSIYLYNIKSYKKSIPDFTKAIEINRDNDEHYYDRGNAYQELGKYEFAIHDFSTAIELNGRNNDAYRRRGEVYLKMGKYPLAEKNFSQYIEIKSQEGPLGKSVGYDNIAEIYSSAGIYDSAIKYYNKALTVARGDEMQCGFVYYDRGKTYYKMGQKNLAISDMKRSAKLGIEEAQEFLKEKGIGW